MVVVGRAMNFNLKNYDDTVALRKNQLHFGFPLGFE